MQTFCEVSSLHPDDMEEVLRTHVKLKRRLERYGQLKKELGELERTVRCRCRCRCRWTAQVVAGLRWRPPTILHDWVKAALNSSPNMLDSALAACFHCLRG